MKSLGVDVLRLRDLDEIYEKGDDVTFDGYVVAEANTADRSEIAAPTADDSADENDEDVRVFFPYQETGTLSFHSNDRFFATTPEPLPEGICGGPVLDNKGHVAGIVEGIVPTTHKNKNIAGSAAFMPNFVISPFIEYAERFMLKTILPKGLFQQAVTAKTTNKIGGGVFQKDKEGNFQPGGESSWEEAFDRAIDQLKENHSKEEVDAILATIRRERQEVLEIMDTEGGDLEEVASRVRRRTMEVRSLIHEEYRKKQALESGENEQKPAVE